MRLKAIFFDAGNTLVFPNLDITLAPLASRRVRPTTEQLHASERAAKLKLDASRSATKPTQSTDSNYWNEYYAHLLGQLNISDPELVASLARLSRTSANWNRILPKTAETLERLRRDFRLGVISNSDGHIAELLKEVGVAQCFDSFTDSGIVGHEKPHPAIFAAAITSLSIEPGESIYIGDIYSVDYLGAKAVGMDAMLMDISGTYEGRDLPRVDNLAELTAKLYQRCGSAT